MQHIIITVSMMMDLRFIFSSPQRRASLASNTSSSAASPSSLVGAKKTLSEQHQQLTEGLIRLKFEIAEQKGKHGELDLDWRRLNSEKHKLQAELLDTEKECSSMREEIGRIREEERQKKQLLDQLRAENSPERRVVDELKAEHDIIQSELITTKEDIEKVKAAGEELHRTIEDIKAHAAKISCDRVKISAESDGVRSDIESLTKDILSMRGSIQNMKEKSEQYKEDLIKATKESELLATKNNVLKSKIAAREDFLAKQKK